MKRILVPIDFSESSANSLKYANDLAKHLERNLTLIYIFPVEEYNRKYDFGVLPYRIGIQEKLKSFYEATLGDEQIDIRFLAVEGGVGETIIDISQNYKLIVLSGNVTKNAFQRFWGKRSSIIASEANCPVLMVPLGVVFTEWEKVWHILRNENEPAILKPFFKPLKIDIQLVQAKSFKQKSYTSSFWKMMVSFWNKQELDAAFYEKIKAEKMSEKIDVIILVSHHKDTFRKFLNDAAKHSFFKLEIPVLVFQER